MQASEAKIAKSNAAMVAANSQAAADRNTLRDMEQQLSDMRMSMNQEKSMLESKVPVG